MTVVQVIISGILLGGIYGLISIGLTLIFGVVRVTNFAHGEFLMVGLYLSYGLYILWGLSPYYSLVLVAAALFLLGIITYVLLIKPLIGKPPDLQILVTIGLSIILQNLALLLFRADYRQVVMKSTVVQVGDLVISTTHLVAFFCTVVMAIILYLFLKRTLWGKSIRAVAQDRNAAALMGIDVHRVYAFTFGLGSALVGIASALIAPIYYAFPTVGTYFVLVAFVVVVLGGLGNLLGALLGGLIIGVVEALSGFYIAPALKEAVYFTIFIVIVLVKPSGVFSQGKGSEEVGFK